MGFQIGFQIRSGEVSIKMWCEWQMYSVSLDCAIIYVITAFVYDLLEASYK